MFHLSLFILYLDGFGFVWQVIYKLCFLGPYPGQPGYNQYGATDQYNSGGPPGQYQQNQGQFPPQNRAMYPPYGPEGGEG